MPWPDKLQPTEYGKYLRVYILLLLGVRGGGLNLQPNFRDRTGGGCWERGVAFLRGEVQFSQKNTSKSEIFNNKKSL